MAITQFIETSGSRAATIARSGTNAQSKVEVEYMCFGTDDDQEVHTYAANFFNTNRIYFINGNAFLLEGYEIEPVASECFKVSASFATQSFADSGGGGQSGTGNPLSRSRSFDTTGKSEHITQALEETRYPASSPYMEKAIGVTDTTVEGVDVVTPAFNWQEDYDVPADYITSTYIRAVAGLTGTVNNAYFRGFMPGEVLFMGVTGGQEWDAERGFGPWKLSYKFIASPNYGVPTGVSGVALRPALSIGDISDIKKEGHDYLWVSYNDDVSDEGLPLKTPKHVYVNQVYEKSNFALLGLGVD
tara:strand:- start:7391 stop:8296 length:906 start_codon:yes stop_codon:yes gene_type:complete